jgi:anti-sigma-K factor RskA
VNEREELHLLSGAHAVDALEGEEKARYEAYLLTSEEARAEVASLSDTAVILGLASEAVTPPADLKARLMAQIAVTPQLAPLTERPNLTVVPPATPAAATGEPSSDESARAIRAAGTSTQTPAGTKAAARWFTRPAAILVAAAAAVALFVGGNILGLSTGQTSQQQAAALSAIVSASDSQSAKAGVSGGGTATFVWSVGLRQSAVVIDKLPKLADGKTYELWYIDKRSNATPAGTFDAAPSGSTVRILDGAMTGGDTLGITIEPSGGSAKPTTAPIVAVASA